MFFPKSLVNRYRKPRKEKLQQHLKSEAKLLKRNISYETDESIKSALIEICIYIVFMVATTISKSNSELDKKIYKTKKTFFCFPSM